MKPNRKRYVRFRLHQSDAKIGKHQLNDALWQELLSLFGESGIADTRLYLNEFDDETGVGILQCNAVHLERVIQAAILIRAIDGTLVSFEPLKTSGTLKSLKPP
ncbi:hypothetical protein EU537_10245 [Candidatus Thorarchaeota archaeon]|nr:MAG: hypothetical protein EU537_10245 [Candidatus Thorarchaeota archaeon]